MAIIESEGSAATREKKPETPREPSWWQEWEWGQLPSLSRTGVPTTATSPTVYDVNSWEYQFFQQHGRWPTAQDRKDREWGEWFARTYGRSPTEADWRLHATGAQGAGEGEDDKWEGTVAQLLTELQFPTTTASVPPYLRGWLGYVQELMQKNPYMGVFPLPELVGGQPARFWKTEEEKQSVQNEWQTLQGLLGWGQRGLPQAVRGGETGAELGEYSPVQQWQHFLNALRAAPIEAQQQIVGLRYSPELANEEKGTSGWYTTVQQLLPHPEHL